MIMTGNMLKVILIRLRPITRPIDLLQNAVPMLQIAYGLNL